MQMRFVQAIGSLIALLLGLISSGASAAPVSCSDDAGVPWREMRLLWRTQIFPKEARGDDGPDLILAGGRLYRAGAGEAACIDPNSGATLWKVQLLVPDPRVEWESGPWRWYLTAAGGDLFLTASYSNVNMPLPSGCIWSIDSATGRVRWKRSVERAVLDRPVAANSTVLVPTQNGRLLALHSTDGSILWDRQCTDPDPPTEDLISVAAEGDVGVLKIRSNDLVGFRVSDGHTVWQVHRGSGSEGRAVGRVAIQAGVAYAWLLHGELTAVRLRSGRVLWRRTAWMSAESVGEPRSHAGGILLDGYWQVTMVDEHRGRTRWFTGIRGKLTSTAEVVDGAASPLLEQVSVTPRIEGKTQKLVCLSNLDAVTAIDPSTGHALWRWQPREGIHIVQVIQASERLLVSTGRELICYAPGPPNPLPTETTLRRRLAADIVERLYGGKSGLAWGPSGRFSVFRYPAEEQEYLVTLLRLGADAGPGLLAELRNRLAVVDRQPIPANEISGERQPDVSGSQERQILDLLVDIADPSLPAQLIALADQVKRWHSRDLVAKALIQYGAVQAAPYLFRYARRPDVDPLVQQAALRFVCRAGSMPGIEQDEVTRFLVEALRQEDTGWLRRFALFELMNDRGDKAFRTALQVFHEEQNRPIQAEAQTVTPAAREVSQRAAAQGHYPELPRSEVEGIYQAVLEGLCALGRATAGDRTKVSGWLDGGPSMLGRDPGLLVLPLPPRSRGIDVRGHPGVVRFDRRATGWIGRGPFGGGRFTPPSIRLDGTWQDARWATASETPRDPFREPSGSWHGPSFRELFPYELAADRSRARIGWVENGTSSSWIFDVEVRKQGSRWFPVECREVGSYWTFNGWELTVPIRPLVGEAPGATGSPVGEQSRVQSVAGCH